jgi:hypothetical protein
MILIFLRAPPGKRSNILSTIYMNSHTGVSRMSQPVHPPPTAARRPSKWVNRRSVTSPSGTSSSSFTTSDRSRPPRAHTPPSLSIYNKKTLSALRKIYFPHFQDSVGLEQRVDMPCVMSPTGCPESGVEPGVFQRDTGIALGCTHCARCTRI